MSTLVRGFFAIGLLAATAGCGSVGYNGPNLYASADGYVDKAEVRYGEGVWEALPCNPRPSVRRWSRPASRRAASRPARSAAGRRSARTIPRSAAPSTVAWRFSPPDADPTYRAHHGDLLRAEARRRSPSLSRRSDMQHLT